VNNDRHHHQRKPTHKYQEKNKPPPNDPYHKKNGPNQLHQRDKTYKSGKTPKTVVKNTQTSLPTHHPLIVRTRAFGLIPPHLKLYRRTQNSYGLSK